MAFGLLHRRLAGLPAMACLILGTTVVTAPAAQAGVCDAHSYYKVSGTPIRMPFRNVPPYKDGPGGTIEVSRSYSGSVSYNVTAGAESEVGAVLAKARVSISASLTKSNSTTTTHTYSHAIKAGKYGHLRYVSWGRRVAWKKMFERSDCSDYVMAKGVIRFPRREEGWFYRQTDN